MGKCLAPSPVSRLLSVRHPNLTGSSQGLRLCTGTPSDAPSSRGAWLSLKAPPRPCRFTRPSLTQNPALCFPITFFRFSQAAAQASSPRKPRPDRPKLALSRTPWSCASPPGAWPASSECPFPCCCPLVLASPPESRSGRGACFLKLCFRNPASPGDLSPVNTSTSELRLTGLSALPDPSQGLCS